MLGIILDETTNTVIVDGGRWAKARLVHFDTKKNKSDWEGKWDWDTHPNATATVIIKNVTIDPYYDMSCVEWFFTARDYKEVVFDGSCTWIGRGRSRAVLERAAQRARQGVIDGSPHGRHIVIE